MQRIPMEFPDPESAVVAIIDASPYLDVACGIQLPDDWKPQDPPFLQVAWDGTPLIHGPAAYATVRCVAWAGGPTAAKALARRALAVLAVHDGSGPVSAITPLTGPLPARDSDNRRAHICSITVRASMRAALIS